MDLWESAVLQARLWKTSLRLGASDSVARYQAVELLSQAGSAALPCLRVHLLREMTPQVQFAAAVALHRLDQPEGLQTLLNALNRPLDVPTWLAPVLEEAFHAIGSPTAAMVLQPVWCGLPEWQFNAATVPDHSGRIQLICRIWAGMRDPLVLDTLLAYATRIPDLFPPTVAAFGQLAIRKMRLAAQSPDPLQRLLVIRTLERIPGEPSFQTVVPLLRDPDPQVRMEACRALAFLGSAEASSEAVGRAIQAGYSSLAAVRLLETAQHPHRFDLLLLVVERTGAVTSALHDTTAAVRVALDRLMQAPRPPDTLLGVLCTLLEKPIPTEIVLVGLAHLAALQGQCPGQEARIQAVRWNLLADLSPDVRARAAQALATWGDPNGKRFLDLLAECRPQGSFLEKLTTLLRGGPDASHAATQAVQQVQQWVTHLSREAVVRLGSPTLSGEGNRPPDRQDSRVPALTRKLLGSALRYLSATHSLEETEEALALNIMVIRVLRRLGAPEALDAQPELLRALHTQKFLASPNVGIGSTPSREIGEPVREQAALALIELLGPESFALFVAALDAPHPHVQGTAILALGRLGDPRAVPYLQPLATDTYNMLAPYAVQALAAIRQNNPEMMTLLRGSSIQEAQPETLLRPARFAGADAAPELLLRPTSQGESTP
jgi:HEAT repeat protein